MFILMATPEAAPFARAGNLAEVIYGLSHALVRSGHRVAVAIPLYRQVQRLGLPGSFTGRTVSVSVSYKSYDSEIFPAPLEPGLDFYFIRQDSLFDRDGLYGNCYGDFQDNAERFIFFSRAVVEMVEALEAGGGLHLLPGRSGCRRPARDPTRLAHNRSRHCVDVIP